MKQYAKVALLLIIVLLINLLGPLWYTPFTIILGVTINILIAFTLAYATYPISKLFMKYKIPKTLANTLTLAVFIGVFIFIGILLIPLITTQLNSVVNILNSEDNISWIKNNEDFSNIYHMIEPYLEDLSKYFVSIIGNLAQNLLSTSTKLISTAVIIFFLYIYMLFDYERIINSFKNKLGYGSKAYSFFRELNYSFSQFLKSFLIINIITIIEYSLVFSLIGHPDWKTLAALVTMSNFIPYFGAIIVNLIALVTAVFVSQDLFFKVLVCVLVLPNIEGNLLNPFVYKKTVKIDPLKTLISLLFLGGLFGMTGVVLTVPLVLIFQVFMKYYWHDTKNLLYKLWNVD